MNTNPERNRPVDAGRDKDPNVRDDSAIQPGVSTISSSDTDSANQELTKTTADGNKAPSESDAKADPVFDEIGDD